MSQLATMLTAKSAHLAANKFTCPSLLAVQWLGLCTLLCFTLYAQAQDAGRILKWKDEKGVTHYGDKIPPQFANRENTIINRQGVTVKHNKPVNQQDQALDLAKLEQDKKDKALLGTFSNAGEIDLARDRNIQLDLMSLETLNQDKHNHEAKLADNQRLADSFSQRKKPIPQNLNADIAKNKEDIAKLDQRINSQKQLIENTRKRFDDDKKRFLMLKHQTAGEVPAAAMPGTLEKPAVNAAGLSKR